MSDDRPEEEDKDLNKSERQDGPSQNPKKNQNESDSNSEEHSAPESGESDAAKPSNDDQPGHQENFDDYIDEDPDADLSDYYYDEIEDYGLDDYDVPRKGPRSVAGKMLSRQRRKDEDEEHDEDEDDSDDEGMSFIEHLEEFRWTIARSVLAFFVGLFIVIIFIRDVSTILQYPILEAYGSVELVEKNLITYRPMGVISVLFQVALLGGLTLSMPFMLYFIAGFVAPGLTAKERAVLRPACLAAFTLFLMGVAFAFFIILPLTLAFSVRLNQFFGFDLLWAASEYYNMVVWFSLATGAFFQFPLLIVILVYLQVLPVDKLRSVRRGVFVALMVFSALMSPGGDFISLPVTTAVMYGLYELAIWAGARIERKKLREVAAGEHDE